MSAHLREAWGKLATAGDEALLYAEWADLQARFPELYGWTFQIGATSNRRAGGQCDFPNQTITVAQWAIGELMSDKNLDTLRHETAHALAGPRAGHGIMWQVQCMKTGANPESTFDDTSAEDGFADPGFKWLAVCPTHGPIDGWFRRPSNTYLCGKCKQELAVVENIKAAASLCVIADWQDIPGLYWDQGRGNRVIARTPEMEAMGQLAAALYWYPGGEISYVVVQEPYRRMGLATEMLRRAREKDSSVHHSDVLTVPGEEWSEAVAKLAASGHQGTPMIDCPVCVPLRDAARAANEEWSLQQTFRPGYSRDTPAYREAFRAAKAAQRALIAARDEHRMMTQASMGTPSVGFPEGFVFTPPLYRSMLSPGQRVIISHPDMGGAEVGGIITGEIPTTGIMVLRLDGMNPPDVVHVPLEFVRAE